MPQIYLKDGENKENKMTLKFQPPFDILAYRSPEQRRLDSLNQTSQIMNQTAMQNRQQSYRDMMMELMKEKEEREAKRYGLEDQRKMMETQGQWGTPAPSEMTTPISGPMTPAQSYRNVLAPTTPGRSGGVFGRFREWQNQNRGMGGPTAARGFPQPNVGYREVLPEIPGYTPEQVRGVGLSGFSRPGTKQLEQLPKLFKKEDEGYVPIVDQSGKVTGRMPKGAKMVTPQSEKPTVAQNAVDRRFALDYADWTLKGGYADSQMQLKQLMDVANQLETGESNLTGPWLGHVPDSARALTHPKSLAAQQQVESSVQRTLKATLGGQFTEREGILFMKRGYDPRLPEEVNAKKLRYSIEQLKTLVEAKEEASKYYEQHGTMRGYAGRTDFQAMFNEMKNEGGGGQGSNTGWSEEKEARYQAWKAGQR